MSMPASSNNPQPTQGENRHPYFESLSIENIRTFDKNQTIHFTDKEGNPQLWNLIIGDNGTGKTTILRALAAFMTGFGSYRRNNSGDLSIKQDYFKRNNQSPKLSIELGYLNSPKLHVFFECSFEGSAVITQLAQSSTGYSQFWKEPGIDLLPKIAAYGGGRKIGKDGFTSEKAHPMANLFDESKTLSNAEDWLLQTDYLDQRRGENRIELITGILLQLFKHEISDIEIREEDEDISHGSIRVHFKTAYGWVKMHDLSLGYKTLIAWVVDFARQMFEFYPNSTNPLKEPAICLVDEVDLHLHPKFQRSMVSFLSDTFPATQFIVTAHSPLIVQSFADANIILLKREADHVVVDESTESIRSYRVDQILTSDLFGLKSTRPEKAEALMKKRRRILSKAELNESDRIEIKQIEKDLDHIPMGETPYERKAETLTQKLAKILEAENDQD